MAVIVAPWLETKPTDFTNAIKAGAQAGTELRGQDLEHAARMAAIAQQGADAQMKAQEEHERNQIAGEVAKNRIALQTGNAANILQQQRQRQLAIEGGMSPEMAFMQYPGTQSGNPGDGAWAALAKSRQASLPMEQVTDPNTGKVVAFHDGNRFYPLPQQKTAANPPMDPKDKMTLDILKQSYMQAQAGLAKAFSEKDPSYAKYKKQAADALTGLQHFGIDPSNPGASSAPATIPGAPSAAPGQTAQPGALQPPKVGNIHTMTNGQRFKQVGPNAADPSHWQEINPQGDTFMGTPGQPNEAELPGGMGDDPSESDTGEGGGEGDTDED